MNHLYKVVWNEAQQAWAAVSEQTKGKGKSKSQSKAGTSGKSTHIIGAILVAGLSLAAAPAWAANNSWTGTTGDWFTPSNWSLNAIPDTLDAALINNGGTAQVTSSTATTDNIYVGYTNSGTLNISNGGVVNNNTGNVGYGASGTGTVTVNNSTWTNSSGLYVGYSGTGTINISNGGAVTNNYGYIGLNTGGTGTVTVDNSTWINSTNLIVGYSGTGTLSISNGGVVNNTTGYIGYNTGGTGTVTVDNSTWTNSSYLYVGYFGASTLTISNGGTVNVNSGGGPAYIGFYGSGTLNIGAAHGQTAAAAGTLNATTVQFGNGSGSGGTGKLVFNHTDTNYVFAPDISNANSAGTHTIELYSGTTRFTGSLSSFSGAMTVDGGTLHVAAGDTLTLGGNYTQTANGTLKIGASSSSNYGKLVVTGTATFAAGTGLKVDVASVNTLAIGNTLSGVVSATGGLTASTFTVTDNSQLFDFTAIKNGNNIDILTSAASSSGGVYSSVVNQGFTPGTGAATVLDGFVNGGTTGTDMDNVVTALGKLTTEAEVSDAVAQTLPLMTAGMTQVASSNMHATNRIVQARQEGSHGISSGDETLSNKHLWVKPVGSWARQSDRNSVSGYKAGSYGIIAGADGELDSANRLGVALSYMRSSVDGNAGSNHANIDAYQAIAYGSHTLAAMPDTELSWQADIGRNNNNGSRIINFGGLDRVASASYHSTTAHVGAGLARNIVLDDSTTVTPAIRADYTYIRDQSYTETGAGGLNLNVNSHSDDEFILLGEGRVSHKLSDKTTLVANAGIGYDVLHGTSSVTASYVGGGAAFTTQRLQASPWLGRVGVGLVSKLNDSTELSVRYDAEVRSGYVDQTASVKVRWAF